MLAQVNLGVGLTSGAGAALAGVAAAAAAVIRSTSYLKCAIVIGCTVGLLGCLQALHQIIIIVVEEALGGSSRLGRRCDLGRSCMARYKVSTWLTCDDGLLGRLVQRHVLGHKLIAVRGIQGGCQKRRVKKKKNESRILSMMGSDIFSACVIDKISIKRSSSK